ncbi:protein EMB-1 [Physcomitrium patens]|uniref:Uncharacterized protein n=1 Tax=Physcomitrium patens TaxID=3218 RepID=A9RE42_PHYPA|nr:protein EMB-1-like [Physcomitrium patens]PNR38175.1 hypothetical protein PHYPA_021286 [Physcomitrium patens]|eukprot:XP_024398409.1 protein EMB-1-like [Physcomitrella patens]
MSSQEDLDAKAAAGETVVPGGTGGRSFQAQKNLAEGRSKGGQARAEQLGHEGYVEMGKKGGSATTDMSSGGAAEAAGRGIDETKFTT